MIKSFLDKYDTVIFDMDGVITSEQAYWDAAALTVYEFMNSAVYFGDGSVDTAYAEENIESIRKTVFFNDKLIEILKGKGVNSNWDLAYMTILLSIIADTSDEKGILNIAESISQNIIEEYGRISEIAAERMGASAEEYSRSGKLWADIQSCFQEWYLGDEHFVDTYKKQPLLSGKKGRIHYERPIKEIGLLDRLLSELSKTKRLCIATGRVKNEIVPALDEWGILKYFDKNGLSTYDYVISAEAETGATVTKPHPYMFLKALYGIGYSDRKILDGDFDKSKISRTLAVGDAGADILASKAMGADFCAVLTGVSGEKARGYFEELNAEYILNSVVNMMEEE